MSYIFIKIGARKFEFGRAKKCTRCAIRGAVDGERFAWVIVTSSGVLASSQKLRNIWQNF